MHLGAVDSAPAVLADVLVTHCRITRRRVVPIVALQCCFVSFSIEMHCGLPLPQHPFLCCAVPFWTTSIDQFVLASIRPARATILIGRRAPSAAPHWMRRAARLCVASLTLYFVRQRPDTKGAPPLYLTPLPNGPFPWCPPDCYRCQRLRNDLLHTEASRPAPLYARCAAPPAHHARPCSLTTVPAGPSSHLVGLRSAVHPAA